jgi:hypothetical protein
MSPAVMSPAVIENVHSRPRARRGSLMRDRLIEAFGGKGYRASTPAQLTPAVTKALAAGARRSSRASSTPPTAPKAAI